MDIFLTILKICGLILLIALVVILIFTLLVLMAPVRYKVLAEFNNDAHISFRVKWLAGVVYFRKDYPDDKGSFRILGIPIGRKKRSKSNKKDKSKQKKEEGLNNVMKSKEHNSDNKEHNPDSDNNDKGGRIYKKTSKKKKQKYNKVNMSSLLSKVKDIFGLFIDEDNKRMISFLKSVIIKIIEHIRPRKVKANLTIGFEDPAATGIFFGILGIVRGFIKGRYEIYPYFEGKLIEGRVKAKGRIFVCVLLCYMIKIYNNRDVKRVIKKGRAV